MPHEIETFDGGTAAFASAREDAWHRLGVVTRDCMTAEQAMHTARLGGWNVRKASVYAEEDGRYIPVPDHYATLRTNPVTGITDYLGVVGTDYRPVQNEQNAQFLNLLTDEAGAHFETAGSLRGGRQTFITMKLPRTLRLAGTDEVDLFLAALNSHDGSTAFRVIVTPVRIVCANTQRMAIASARSSFSVRHTAGATARIAEARNILRLTWAYTNAFEQEAERLIHQTLDEEQFRAVIDQLWPPPEPNTSTRARTNHRRRAGTLDYLFTEAPTQAAVRGTGWAGLQAIGEYLDHHAPARDDDARAARVLTSSAVADLKQRAYLALAA